jgi:hypothetical protein
MNGPLLDQFTTLLLKKLNHELMLDWSASLLGEFLTKKTTGFLMGFGFSFLKSFSVALLA